MALTYPATTLSHDLNPDTALNSGKRKLHDGPPPTPSKRTKTVGPFVIEEDDDEEYDAGRSLYTSSTPRTEPRASPTHVQLQHIPDSIDTSSVNKAIAEGKHESSTQTEKPVLIRTCSGKAVHVSQKKKTNSSVSYERMIAARSVTAPGRATKGYYGIDIHKLLDESAVDEAERLKAPASTVQPSIETPVGHDSAGKQAGLLWTEKYRARKFKDLIGDERTHRLVLRWLKGWDPIVFPGLSRQNAKRRKEDDGEDRQHRKVLLLTGAAGLGKTTLAHVCAKQAGYEVLEINASDERSRDVVKGRIRDAVGTENVKGMPVDIGGQNVRKSGKPVCVVVDEVDGVVTGSGGGEGGFMKALVDLLTLDQQNSNKQSDSGSQPASKSKKGDKFRLLRPLILVCNDVYHPSLRPLRTSFFAEIIHVRQVHLEQVVQRMRSVFQNEGIPCDGDGVRKLCEASWGLSAGRDRQTYSRGSIQGDIRGVLVAAQWVAHKLRCSEPGPSARLTRRWIEQHILNESAGGTSSRGLGRGGTRDIVERVFVDGAGFPYQHGTKSLQGAHDHVEGAGPVGVADLRKRHAIERLTEMVDAAGEYDRCITGCFLTYPSQNYQDDTYFSKPNAAYDWLHFHDSLSSRVYSHQDWELNPYLGQPVAAFHHLFSSPSRPPNPEKREDDDEDEHPFSGSRADFAAFETEKQNRAILSEFQSSLSAPLLRIFRSAGTVATELVPSLLRMLAPDLKPIIVGGSGGQGSVATVRKESERVLVKSAVGVMNAVGVTFDKTRVEMDKGSHGGWILRIEPPVDTLSSFSKVKGTPLADAGSSGPVRYAIRQVLEQEYHKDQLQRQAQQQQKRLDGAAQSSLLSGSSSANSHGGGVSADKLSRLNGPKKDFFGRVINDEPKTDSDPGGKVAKAKGSSGLGDKETKVWVSYHEGFSNAVRKGISMHELLSGL